MFFSMLLTALIPLLMLSIYVSARYYHKTAATVLRQNQLVEESLGGQVEDYLGKMDFTLLTSISEGQPLTILESYAAHKPVIATDVGNCRELIYGSNDDFGEAGILTHIMNIEEIAHAMVTMSLQEEERLRMGEAGYKRVNAFYRIEQMKAVYQDIYKGFSDKQGLEWTEEPFSIGK